MNKICDIKSKFNAFCNKNILEKCENVVAGVSGGADSLSMLLLLEEFCKNNNIRLICAHFNHKIRGKDADDDENFVREVCEKIGADFKTACADVSSYAKNAGISEEMAGRKLRYDFFHSISESLEGRTLIAVAHTQNDKAETVFLNIARGSGTRGLSGITETRDDIVRPVIFLSRDDTEFVCDYFGYKFRIDKTNSENNYKRNIVRNVLLPEIMEYFPDFSDKLINLSEITGEEDKFLQEIAKKAFEKCASVSENGEKVSINRNVFRFENPVIQSRIVRICASELNFKSEKIFPACNGFDRNDTQKAVRFILEGETGKTIELHSGVICKSFYDIVEIYHKNASLKNENICTETEINFEKDGEFIVGNNIFTVKSVNINDVSYINDNNTVYFDIEKLKTELCMGNSELNVKIRFALSGDIIKPFNGSGEKMLRRYFTDIKIRKDERASVLLMAYENKILWIPGIRRSDFGKVEKNSIHVIMVKHSIFD